MLRTALVTFGAGAISCGAMAQPIGVPACDAWLEKLEARAVKLPEDMQDDLKALNANARQLLRDLSKRDAEAICGQNQAGYRRTKPYQDYGCRF